ncbi:MAG: hypothetical protein JNK58_10895 [Phycisphaerae bacterium]|nr:hypothetical protein [Phycisphaerae bacterium]
MTQPPSIQRFFNDVSPNSDPFGLLGLDPRNLSDNTINTALNRRLQRLALHPLSATPEAEEVRQALHVAAAQLRDPSVRAELVHDALIPRADPRPENSTDRSRLEQELLAAIAASGGWNARARARIAAIAARHNLPPRAAVTAAASLAGTQRAAPTQPTIITDTQPSPPVLRARAVRRWTALAVMVLLVVSTILLAERLATIQRQFRDSITAETPPDATPADRDSTPATPRAAPPIESDPLRGAAPNPTITPSRRPGPSIVPAPPIGKAQPLDPHTQKWIAAADLLLSSRTDPDEAPEFFLARAIRFARINLAARLLRENQPTAAEDALRAAELTPTTSSPRSLDPSHDPATFTAPGLEPDGALALELLTLRRNSGRGIDAFKSRRFGTRTLGPADCDAAAETALVGAVRELRLLGRRIVTEQSDNPAMINALIESLPHAPRQPANSDLIEEITGRTLPDAESADWPVLARAALIERLAELLAPEQLPDTDRFAGLLAAAYGGRDDSTKPSTQSIEAPPDSTSRQPVADDPLTAAHTLWNDTLAAAAPLRARRDTARQVDSVRRDREARLRFASGPIQQFVAEQSSIADLLALLVRFEQPQANPLEILNKARSDRRTAHHVFRQIEINERAITRLWRLRLAGAPEEQAP